MAEKCLPGRLESINQPSIGYYKLIVLLSPTYQVVAVLYGLILCDFLHPVCALCGELFFLVAQKYNIISILNVDTYVHREAR